jgi:subtilisin family serine protease
MPDTADIFVSAYVDNESERDAAMKLLRDPVEYQGVVEGYATKEVIAELTKRQVVCTIQKGEAAPAEDPLGRRSKYNDPDLHDRLMELDMRAEDMSADTREMAAPAGAMASAEETSQPMPFKLKLQGPIRPQWREELQKNGAEIVSYQRGMYRALIDPQKVDAVRALPFVKEVADYDLSDSVSSSVLLSIEKKKEREDNELLADAGAPEPETFDVMVHREDDLPRVVDYIKSRADAEYVEQSSNAVRFRAVADSVVVATVAKMPEVARVVQTAQPTLYMDRARALVGVMKVNQAAPPKQWTGKGEVVAVLDSGIDATHPDLKGQFHTAPISFRGCSVVDNIGHGTHVAGIIAGTGKKSDGAICGVAPDAKLVIVGMVNDAEVPQIPLDIGELLDVAVKAGAKIINASWGRRLGSAYDSGSRSVDKFIAEHPDVLLLVAAGNEGEAPKGTYKFGSIGAPATAKNVLTVGASITDRNDINGTWGTFRPSLFPVANAKDDPVSGDPDKVAGISSRGPTDYDSIKPDVIAPGTYILAPRAKNFKQKLEWKPGPDKDYVYVGGTSMATPVVSGLAAVLRQYLREERNAANPSAALLKAILISATKPVPQRTDPAIQKIGFPDFEQGFGRIDISSIIPDVANPSPRRLLFADVANDSADALESRAPVGGARKSTRTYKLKIAAGAKAPLVVTLAWTDPPGNDLQNNLQLDLRGQGDILLIGNANHVFMKDPDFGDLSPNGVVLDKRNNVEQIRVDAAEPGEYLIRVSAFNTVLPPQGYALAVVGSVEGDLATG